MNFTRFCLALFTGSTSTLPCTLWFFDKGKPDDLLNTVLMIDARNIYTVVSARSHVFTEEQLANLTAITWLYRGEHDRFTTLLASYQAQVGQYLTALPERLAADAQQIQTLASALRDFAKATETEATVSAVRAKLSEEHGVTDAALTQFRTELAKLEVQATSWDATLEKILQDAKQQQEAITALPDNASFPLRKAMQAQLDEVNPALKAALTTLEARHKGWLRLLDLAEKSLRARQWTDFDGNTAREAKKALQPRDTKKREKLTVRDLGVEAFKRASYFVSQGRWLLHRFPDGLYEDVPGLCKAVTRQEIAANDYSLTPGRYVGAPLASPSEDDMDAFISRMEEIHADLADLNSAASKLAAKIQEAFEEICE